MSAKLDKTLHDQAAFHRCVSHIARRFHEAGELTRRQMESVCYEHHTNILTVFVYLEAAGMRRAWVGLGNTRSPSDKFRWPAL